MEVSRENVAEYLADVKQAVVNDRYRISPRQKNEEIYDDYVFSEEKCKEILLDLCVEDFSDAVGNEHIDYQHEVLYIFGKDVRLMSRYGNNDEIVPLYIKFNKLTNMYLIVISFHKQEYPLRYKFK